MPQTPERRVITGPDCILFVATYTEVRVGEYVPQFPCAREVRRSGVDVSHSVLDQLCIATAHWLQVRMLQSLVHLNTTRFIKVTIEACKLWLLYIFKTKT